MVVKRKNWKFFLFTTIKKYVVIPLGWGGGLFDELFKSSR
jgi:hypothetical protein